MGRGLEFCGDTERCLVIANAFLKESHFLTLFIFFGLGPGLRDREGGREGGRE